jgi:hypothetical protein
MKKFQGVAEPSSMVELRPILRETSLDRPAATPPHADSGGSQNRRAQPEPAKPETRANRAHSRKMILKSQHHQGKL